MSQPTRWQRQQLAHTHVQQLRHQLEQLQHHVHNVNLISSLQARKETQKKREMASEEIKQVQQMVDISKNKMQQQRPPAGVKEEPASVKMTPEIDEANLRALPQLAVKGKGGDILKFHNGSGPAEMPVPLLLAPLPMEPLHKEKRAISSSLTGSFWAPVEIDTGGSGGSAGGGSSSSGGGGSSSNGSKGGKRNIGMSGSSHGTNCCERGRSQGSGGESRRVSRRSRKPVQRLAGLFDWEAVKRRRFEVQQQQQQQQQQQ
jgi:hypothetical protein